jgi:cell division protein FtsL
MIPLGATGSITARRSLAVVLAVALFGSALALVTVRHDGRKASFELERLEQERDALNDDWGRLQLEQATVRTQAQVESLARSKLSMTVPRAEDVVLMVSP